MISSQSQNPYVYCMNNPLRFIDPTGMMGDIPDWSLPENYFDGYVNSVGSLINTVVNTATEFAAGVNHGVAAGTTSASGSAGVPNPGTTYSPSNEHGYGSDGGQGYWDNGDINLPANQVPSEIHGNLTLVLVSIDYSLFYNPETGKVVDRISIGPGGVIGHDPGRGIIPYGGSIVAKNIDIDFDTYINTSATATITAGYNFGGEVTLGDSNGDGKLEVFSHGIGYVSPGGSINYGTPWGSEPLFSEGGLAHDIFFH